MKDYSKERKVLAQIYSNEANTIKYLPFFFKDKKELVRFFNQFGGKILVLPDTLEEFMQICLNNTKKPKNDKQIGIDSKIHERTKNKIIQTYLNLYDRYEDVIYNECKYNNT